MINFRMPGRTAVSRVFLSALVIASLSFSACKSTVRVRETRLPPRSTVPAPDVIAKKFSRMLLSLKNKKVAVMEFTYLDGSYCDMGSLFAERLTTSLAQVEGVSVIERLQIKKVLGEQNFGLSGAVDEKNSVKTGNLLGADAIITGTVAPLKNWYEINARLIDTEKGSILAAASAKEEFNAQAGNAQAGASNPAAGAVLPVQDEETVEKAKPGRVEVLESKLEKIKEGLGKDYAGIRITGRGIYVPSAKAPKDFSKAFNVVKVDLVDGSGYKMGEFTGVFYCGEYGMEENISPGVPFPFKAEDLMIRKSIWEKISGYRFVSWACE